MASDSSYLENHSIDTINVVSIVANKTCLCLPTKYVILKAYVQLQIDERTIYGRKYKYIQINIIKEENVLWQAVKNGLPLSMFRICFA